MLKLRFAVPLAALIAVTAVRAQECARLRPRGLREALPGNGGGPSESDGCPESPHGRAAGGLEADRSPARCAKKARGDKKVAALESVVEKLVAFHASAPGPMDGCPMMGGPGHMAGGPMGCCGGGAGMKGCCGAGGPGPGGRHHNCPMMKGQGGPPPAN